MQSNASSGNSNSSISNDNAADSSDSTPSAQQHGTSQPRPLGTSECVCERESERERERESVCMCGVVCYIFAIVLHEDGVEFTALFSIIIKLCTACISSITGTQSSNQSEQHSRSNSSSSLSPSTLSQDSQPILSQPSTGGGSVGAVAEFQGATPVSSGGSADAQQSE